MWGPDMRVNAQAAGEESCQGAFWRVMAGMQWEATWMSSAHSWRSFGSSRKSVARSAIIFSTSSLHCGVNPGFSLLSSRHSLARALPGGTSAQNCSTAAEQVRRSKSPQQECRECGGMLSVRSEALVQHQ